MVEARGVEPLSKNLSTSLSPGAVDYFGISHFPHPKANQLAPGVGSFIIHGALKALRTHVLR